jgi:drug/metabolite transporter (DMT)-like permease
MALMLLATIGFTIAHTLVRSVSTHIHPFEVVFFRNFFGMFVVLPWLLRYGLKNIFRTQRLGLHLVRVLLAICAMTTFFYALSITPLARATALSFTAPIFGTVLAMFILGEVVRLRRWTAIIIGFLGTLVVLRPGFDELDYGSLLVLLSTLFSAFALIDIKILGRTESTITMTSYMVVLLSPVSLIPALFVWQWPNAQELALLAGVGIISTLSLLLSTNALKLADTNVITPMEFFRLIWAAALGFLVFGEIPTLYTWIGGVMIFASMSYIAYREYVLSRERQLAAMVKAGEKKD